MLSITISYENAISMPPDIELVPQQLVVFLLLMTAKFFITELSLLLSNVNGLSKYLPLTIVLEGPEPIIESLWLM